MKNGKSKRYTLVLSEEESQGVTLLKERTGARTDVEVFRIALSLLHHMMKIEKDEGALILKVGGSERQLIFPMLSMANMSPVSLPSSPWSTR